MIGTELKEDFMDDQPIPGEESPEVLPTLETPEPDPSIKRAQTRRMILDIIETLLLALVLYFGIDAVSSRVRVENISMKPTLHEGEFVLVSKLAYKLGSPKVGDIVVFHAPTEPGEDFIKRVIGTPGDDVKVEAGKVYVNGHRLDEPYIADVPRYEGEWTVPAGNIFVLGDNRNQSSDSHRWGYVTEDKLVGKAVLVYWPFSDFAVLEHPDVVSADGK